MVAISGVVQQPNVFYMGAVGGGIWKSDDYGVTWRNISDKTLHSSSISIGAIAVAPSDPDIIYAGTGEADIRNDFITGNGMYKSTDAGKTWNYIGLKDTHTISDVVVDPQDPNVVYVASLGHVFVDSNKPDAYNNGQGGVYKTSDGGQTWKKVLFVNDKTGAIDLAMDAQNPQIIYAAMWQVKRTPWKLTSGGPGSGLYKSSDGGTHWTNITRNHGLPSGVIGRIGVAVAPSQPNIVYAIVQAKEGGGLFRSEDSGQTWTRVNRNWELRQRGFYYSTVYVDPRNPNTIYMPQVRALWVSYDGGRKIGILHTPHGDNHIAWVNPNNPQIIEEGNDGGATVSVNGGRTWTGEHDQPTGEFYHANLDNQFPFHIYGAQQDEGSSEGSSSAPEEPWKRVTGGESIWVVPQPGAPWINYGYGYYTLFNKMNRKIDVTRDISPWPDYQSAAAADELKYRLAWTHPMLFAPSNPQELLVGAQYVLESMDHGATWKEISPDLTRNDKATEGPTGGPVMLDESAAEIYPYISALAASPLNSNIIWAGSSDGLVHITTDGGQHWRAITPPALTQWADISSIAASYTDQGTAYLTASRYQWDDFKPYVFKTTDYGRHWAGMTQGLPDDDYVTFATIDPNNRNLVFLSVRNGVYVSINGGSQWQSLDLNLPHALAMHVAIQPEQNAVVVATHGRAFWVLDNLALLEQLASGVSVTQGSPHLFTPQLTWLTKSYGSRGFLGGGGSTTGVESVHPFGASIFFDIPADYNGTTPVTLQFTTGSGQVVNTYQLHLKATREERTPSMAPTSTTSATTAELAAADAEKAEAEATAIGPGMNVFRWDLRYPGITKINGYFSPREATNGYSHTMGPQIVPGTYYAVLQYGDQTQRAAFQVKLDPRLTTTQADLQARQKLLSDINSTLNDLAVSVNHALVVKGELQNAINSNPQDRSRYERSLASLDSAIGVLMQAHMQSSEGDLAFEPRLRDRLASLFMAVAQAYVVPSQAEYEVFSSLNDRIHTAINQMKATEQSAAAMH